MFNFHRPIYVICLTAFTLATAPALTTYAAEQKPANVNDLSGVILAESSAHDRAAKRIRKEVSEDGLKTITTKEDSVPSGSSDVLIVQGTSTEQLAVDHLEPGPSLLKPTVTVEAAPGAREPASEKKKQDSHAATATDKHSSVQHTTTHSNAHSSSPDPETAQKWLENGNRRYVSKAFRTDGRTAADRKKLQASQAPHTIVLSCSDSRVPPEIVFDQALGEIFVIRTAGESLDSAVIASIEYAVEHLGPKLIVVMGHTSCGAVNAALNTEINESAGSPALDQMIAEIRPRIPGNTGRSPAAQHSHALEIETAANAQGVAADLAKRSEIVRTRILNGQLKIKPALYYLDSGLVKFY